MAPRKRGIAAPVKKPRLGARYMYISETESESEEINTAPPKKPGLKNKKEDVPPVAQTGKQDEEQQPAANASLVQSLFPEELPILALSLSQESRKQSPAHAGPAIELPSNKVNPAASPSSNDVKPAHESSGFANDLVNGESSAPAQSSTGDANPQRKPKNKRKRKKPKKKAPQATPNDPAPLDTAEADSATTKEEEEFDPKMAYIPPNQQRHMRACMVCSIVRTQQQFVQQGCPNCDTFLELVGNLEAIQDCTSQVFDGLITVTDTSKSWVARWQRLEGYVPGVYAVQVEGVLPEDMVAAAESAGVHYIPRDGSVNEALPTDA